MRVAVAHEWLTNWAGSETVAYQMADVAGADHLVSAVVDPDFAARHFPGLPVRSLWSSRLPAAADHWSRYALPMMAAWATTKIDADALLISSHFGAHGAALRFEGPSIAYYHTPGRLFWRPDLELGRLPARLRSIAEALLPVVRHWDRRLAQKPTVLLANSSAVRERIQSAYGRDATVLHPPVDVRRWGSVERAAPSHLLWFGRLVAYKKPWLAIETARRLGVPLVVVGDGPERPRLEAAAPANVTFLGHASEAVAREAVASASALIFPGEEDFGIVPVEALAAGVPIVAFGAGGALDYVQAGRNGVLVSSQDADEFEQATKAALATDWDEATIRASAFSFDISSFRAGFKDVLRSSLGDHWKREAAA